MDALPVECLCMIAGYLPEADRASLRAASAWLAWSLVMSDTHNGIKHIAFIAEGTW